jgi:hypothetical protein
MDLKQIFLAQLEREAVATRRTLERVPEGRNDWKPTRNRFGNTRPTPVDFWLAGSCTRCCDTWAVSS